MLCGVAVLLAACGSGASERDWESVSSSAGGFRADFPVEPQQQVQRVPAAGSALELVLLTAETSEEAVSISYVDYPMEPAGEELASLLDSAVEGAASAIQGQNLNKESVRFLGREAVDFTVEADPQVSTGRAFMVGNRMYVLQVVHLQTVQNDSFERLASSFALIETPAPPPSPVPTSS